MLREQFGAGGHTLVSAVPPAPVTAGDRAAPSAPVCEAKADAAGEYPRSQFATRGPVWPATKIK